MEGQKKGALGGEGLGETAEEYGADGYCMTIMLLRRDGWSREAVMTRWMD